MNSIKILGPFTQVISLRGLKIKGPIKDHELEVIPNGAVLIKDNRIYKLDSFNALVKDYPDAEVQEIHEKSVLLPGLIDAHTHICYAGTRAADFAARNNGSSYQEIAAAGGGIWSTVKHTRNATEDELARLTVNRLNQLLLNGITTVEVKSGYGLSTEQELKILRTIKKVSDDTIQTLVPTCLAAHILPKDFDGNQREYLKTILTDLLPIIKAEKLCYRFDIFTEENAFGVEESEEYLNYLSSEGFDLTVHGDQFNTGGSEVAVKCGAISVDHLEVSRDNEIKRLAKSNTIATALPGASLGIGCGFTPARKILDAGCALVIASDWNPGSAPMGDLVTQASILAAYQKLSTAEVFAALTFRAAAALKLFDRGTLNEGMKADFVSFPISDYREILYHQGTIKPNQVWINGCPEI